MWRTLRLGAGFVLAVAALSPTALARDLTFRPCAGTPDYECSSLNVPLDPGGRRTGEITLHVRRLVETREAPDVLVALAGGPGQSSTEFIEDFGQVLAEGLEDRQLVVVDQRGTGASGALRCRELDRAPALIGARELAARAGRCGERLGAARRLYTTTEVVEDLDAVRDALGAERISIFGVSYGAYVAQRYARRFPQHIDRLVLDSPVSQLQGGAFDRSSYRAVGNALRRLCGDGGCRAITRDPVADLRRLVRRLAGRPVRGRVFNGSGQPRTMSLRGAARLFDLIVSSDLSPPLRAGLPAAISSALRGDEAPLVRLVALDEGTADGPEVAGPDENVREFSSALFFATTCQEKPLPWATPEAPLRRRRALRRAALSALPAGALAPFTRAAADSTQVGTAFCERWPRTSVAPVPEPGLIDAPALVLSGLTDVRTPPAEARSTAALISDASLVRVPGGAHSLVSSGLPCVQTALTRFFSDRAVGNPCAGRAGGAPAPPPPRRGGDLAAALATVRDAARVLAMQGLLDGRFRFGGLRGGSVCAHPGGVDASGRPSAVLALRDDRYLRRLPVTGRAVLRRGRIVRMRLSVGPGARATLRLNGPRLRLRTPGRTVRTRVRAGRLAVPRFAVDPALSTGRRRPCR
jgi:pimeloyl-ACP methyl ester carboxylesterase